MITLCGFSLSNYYNKVKLVLLEKGIAFEEKTVKTGLGDAVRASSPLAKIPFLETPQGPLAESSAIVEWIEATHPNPPLLPADPWQAAKIRELNVFLETHLELAVRQLYPQAFFRSPLPEKYVERVKPQIEQAIAAVKQLARFEPYIGGSSFTLADCAAFVHLPLAGLATKLVYGSDLLTAAGIDWKSYVRTIEQRPAAQKVSADRKKAEAALAAGG
ncbi:MAG TPA: glutathione S-transferase [Methylibium sp.]|uniref:glutathione S-transferase family protein n=1 Tax=Methylibium sp. TaxID=2067992 RepID=UPI002DBDBC6A|nr:glutathione S-transferase [Methylibium sp.]HEU4460427.1 glutathione S-transferase [Methylibium sp.]